MVALAPWFEQRVAVGGDTHTVNAARVSLRPDATTGELYLDEHGPSLRAVYDLGDPTRSRFMHSTGQSGIVFSPLFRSHGEFPSRETYIVSEGDPAMLDGLTHYHRLRYRLLPYNYTAAFDNKNVGTDKDVTLILTGNGDVLEPAALHAAFSAAVTAIGNLGGATYTVDAFKKALDNAIAKLG